MAITGSQWLPEGWRAVELLALLSFGKLLSSSLTIGSGGSAGDFAPSLAIGGLFGGAFGRAAQLLLGDPQIDPGAFALVGMGVFYGGIAHAPLSALVLVCEMAGNYDLLVPLMLALGISYVALRKTALYESQVGTPRESPVHRDALLLDLLHSIRVIDLLDPGRTHIAFDLNTPARDVLNRVGEATDQDVFPVLDGSGALVGLVAASAVRILAVEREDTAWTVAADLMQPVVSVGPNDDLQRATQTLLSNGLRAVPVVDHNGRFIGFLDEDDVASAYIQAASRAEASSGGPRSTGGSHQERRNSESRSDSVK
jgi:chloride channel protein, CIC family